MTRIRWEPVRELASLQSEMNRLFGTFLEAPAAGGGTPARRWMPAMDLVEHDDHFVLRADLPGLDQQDISIELQDDVLTIAGERPADHEQSGTGFFRLERPTGAFSRTLTLPDGVDADQVAASFERGVLEIRIPKPAQRRPRRVSISVGDRPAAIEGEATETTQATDSAASREPAVPAA